MTQIDTNIERWPGHIVLPEYMNFPQLSLYQRALASAQKNDDSDDMSVFFEHLLPMAFKIVKEWHIKGLPEDLSAETFPASPALVSFVVTEIANLFNATNGIDPNSPAQS